MAARKRRRTSAQTARLAAILLANVAALALLWGLLARPGGELRAAAVGGAAQQARAVLQRREPVLREETLLPRLRAIVRTRLAEAERLSKGRARADSVRVAIHVRELGARGAGLGINVDRAQPPASNMKLVTSAAALVLLGPGWHFDTAFEAAGPLRDGRLRGDLVARAAGDPLYDPAAAGSVDALLAPLVRELAAAGLREIEGDLVLDERGFPEPAPAPGWPPTEQHWAEYCALAGGFSANRGCLTATVSPTTAGSPARVRVEPHAHGLPQSIGVTTAASGPLNVRLGALGRAGVVVRGEIPRRASSWSDSFAHPDPVELFGSALAEALARGGIRLRGRVRRERGAPGGQVLGHLRSPLAATLVPINTDSNNAVADQLFLAVGQAVRGAGTRTQAAAATAAALERLGVPAQGLAQVDGSGLSRDNRATARQLTALITAVLEMGEPAATLFRGSLAVSGESGKLAGRLVGEDLRGRVQAKTGFIAGVSALSGVVQGRQGHEYVFSILVEYPEVDGLNSSCFKPMQDEICALLARLEP